MARTNMENILLYGGGFIIVYYILKSWGIITTSSARTVNTSTVNKFNLDWKPLSEQELNNLKVKTLLVNPYVDDSFDVRTERGRTGQYGFAGK